MLTIALLRTLVGRKITDDKQSNARRDFKADIEISKLSNQLKFIIDHNLKSRNDLKVAADKVEHQIRGINVVLKEANEMNRSMKLVIQTINTYNKYKPIYDELQGSTIKRILLKKKYNTELETFEKAFNQLKKMGVKEPEFALYPEKQLSYEQKIEQLKEKLDTSKGLLSKFGEIEKTLNQRNQILLPKNKNSERPLQKYER